MDNKQILEKLEQIFSKENIKQNEPMKSHTSFKIGGNADVFVKINTIEELKNILNFCKDENVPITIIGNGSNILVTEKGIRGITIKLELKNIQILDESKSKTTKQITVDSGVQLGFLAQKLLKEEIEGFEELSGIPGTIGGAVIMNAGAHGKEMKDIVTEIVAIDYDGNIHKFTNEQAKFEYRKEKQPIEFPSAGSTFKRGKDFITAKLIDDAGLKGYSIGGAQISEKHAGFIINTGNATAKDVLDLVHYAKEKVYEKFDKKIELEIKVLGEI